MTRDRRQRGASSTAPTGRSSATSADHPPAAPVGQRVPRSAATASSPRGARCRAAAAGARPAAGWPGGGAISAERLAGGQRAEHEREADPDDAEHDAEHQRPDHERARRAPSRSVAGDRGEALGARPRRGGAAAARPLIRSSPRSRRRALERAWIWNGASSAAATPRTHAPAVVGVGVDLVAAGRHDRVHVAGARAQLEALERARRGRARRRPPARAPAARSRRTRRRRCRRCRCRSAPSRGSRVKRTVPEVVRTVTGTLSGTVSR